MSPTRFARSPTMTSKFDRASLIQIKQIDPNDPEVSPAKRQRILAERRHTETMKQANIERKKTKTLLCEQRDVIKGATFENKLFDKLMAFDGQKQLDGLKTYLDAFKPSVETNLKTNRDDIYAWRTRTPTTAGLSPGKERSALT